MPSERPDPSLPQCNMKVVAASRRGPDCELLLLLVHRMPLSQTIKAVSSASRQVDPSRLVAPSPGKLVRYTVPDGGTLSPDQPYAEVEVCPSLIWIR